MKTIKLLIIAAASAVGFLGSASASEMVYHPVNPTFGGSPLNGAALLSQAQAQGEGVKSGPQGPDLSGLNNALGNVGTGTVIIGGTPPGGTNGNNAGSTTP